MATFIAAKKYFYTIDASQNDYSDFGYGFLKVFLRGRHHEMQVDYFVCRGRTSFVRNNKWCNSSKIRARPSPATTNFLSERYGGDRLPAGPVRARRLLQPSLRVLYPRYRLLEQYAGMRQWAKFDLLYAALWNLPVTAPPIMARIAGR